MKRIIARTRSWKTGDPLDPRHHLGALVDKEHFKKVSGYLRKGKAIVGGKTEQGCYVLPTVIDGVKPAMAGREHDGGAVGVVGNGVDDGTRFACHLQVGDVVV